MLLLRITRSVQARLVAYLFRYEFVEDADDHERRCMLVNNGIREEEGEEETNRHLQRKPCSEHPRLPPA